MPRGREHTSADVLIVGGGSAGCVLANRLSADGARRVLLVECGPQEPAAAWQPAVRDGRQPAVKAGLNWKYRCFIKGDPSPREEATAGVFHYEAGRVLGGSSAVNATQALRASPADHARWAARAGPAWSWDAALPLWRLLEDDPLGPSALHGRGGPMPVRRDAREALQPLHAAFLESCLAHGFGFAADLNDPHGGDVGMLPKNVVDGVRQSAASAYLAPALARPNLRVLADARVLRLLWTGPTRCGGVEVLCGGQLLRLQAGTTVLCAGVVGTPALLLHSGVGPAEQLRALGLPVRLPLQGVGHGLSEHPVVGLWGRPVEGRCSVGEPLRQTLLRCALDGGAGDDLHLCMMSGLDAREQLPRLAATTGAAALAGLTVTFNRPASRGSVRLASADPLQPPRVAIHCLADPADTAALAAGVRLGWQLLQGAPLRHCFQESLAWNDALLRSPAALHQAVRAFVRPAAHLCGSTPMGPDADAGDVVDAAGRVHGAAGLWIADGSVIPAIPSVPPHWTVLLFAEGIARQLIADPARHAAGA
jgi:choline dehydrogenase